MPKNCDFVIIGAGIVGLSVAREIASQFPDASVVVLEKESSLGRHASGRNSGILHSGIYYPSNTLKAQFCASGAKELIAYCQQYNLPCLKTGKIILPVRNSDDTTLTLLYERAKANGANVSLIDQDELKEMEPNVKLANQALYTPDTAVVDPIAILSQIRQELLNKNVKILFDQEVLSFNPEKRQLKTSSQAINYRGFFNCAGVNADLIAKKNGLGSEYAILPFKGRYFKLISDFKIKHQIYPVPDLQMPFLGIHLTKNIHQELFLGPTASPVFGRHHYQGIKGLALKEVPFILQHLLKLYWRNSQNFRQLVHQQAFKNVKKQFLSAAKQLVPTISEQHLQKSSKVGIRPQLINIKSGEMIHDFIVLEEKNMLHVLNAISPAFTSSFPFARYLVERMMHQVINNG